jgi:superfamily I DNA/RNA helicase
MTRAERRLLLTYAKSRLRHGKIRKQAPSPFLKAIGEQLVERRKSTARRRVASTPDPQMDLFSSENP